ncbi:unnamed protein product [Kuraishia capsulata CBS 1993]|uniref:Magnesium transporter n=1 Tax=Kuraishia capsulata CBS 1993 TaxID=1382522 RepID=W6ML69_9ASCO|nr:uncharacterized protein KUCA_T00003212001 [Kuraishia capsulata CBS 1993]CDK27234.1 unnamed protein product [Kuraishia capsulata CBS 1993]
MHGLNTSLCTRFSSRIVGRFFKNKPYSYPEEMLCRQFNFLSSAMPIRRGTSGLLSLIRRRQLSTPSDLSQQDYNRILLSKNLTQKNTSTLNEFMRCLVFNEDGNLVDVASDIKKSDLIVKHDLLPRDLRKIDKGYDDIVPSILVRPQSILLSLLNIRALVKADSVVLFNHRAADSTATQLFVLDLESKLKTPTAVACLPYEIRALEAIFISVMGNLHSEMKVHTTVVKGVLQELEDHIDRAKLKYLLIESKKLTQFHQKATLIRNLLDELLDDDEILCDLYLSDRAAGRPRQGADHQEVEFLLESYLKHSDEIVQTVESYISDIKTTEEIINIILDSNRNQLMLLGLRYSAGLLSFGFMLYLAAVYGMNLENFIEEKDFWFWIVTLGSTAAAVFVFVFSIKKLNRLQKITMVGDGVRSPMTTNFRK